MLHSGNPGSAPRKHVGARLQRREDQALIQGQGRFVDDVFLPHALHVGFVRSVFGAGRIVAVDCSPARNRDSVIAAYCGADVAHLGDLPVNAIAGALKQPPYPVLANGYVRAVGQPLAAVLCRNAAEAADAGNDILVDIEDGPAMASIASARTPASAEEAVFEDIPGNVAFARTWREGDVEHAFAQAAYTVSVEVAHPRLAPAPLEPRSIAADYDDETGNLTIYLSTQTPHRSRADLAGILGIEPSRLRLISPDVGGAFGMKASLYPEEVFVAWAALTLRRPVRWTATRSEEFLSASQGRGGVNRGTLALAADGRFLALRADMTSPLGHWLTTSAAIPAWNSGRILPGPYLIDAVDISTRGILTHTAPVGIYRGAGRPEAALMMERLVEKAARTLGIDPVDLRRRNLIPAGRMPHTGPTGIRLDSGDYRRALDTLCSHAGYEDLKEAVSRRRTAGEIVGLGMAFYVEPCGRGWESARVETRPDGTIVAATGSSSQGHGRQTAYAQIVADVFDVAPENVEVRLGDTETCPAGIGALASRSTAIGGSALLTAARQARADASKGDGSGSAEIVYETDDEAWGFGCHLALVCIDAETGTLSVESITCLDDIGTVINPMLVEGQIMGGIAQGFGEAVLERLVYTKDGQLLTGSLSDYALPRADTMPAINIVATSTLSPNNLLGAKGVGEAGTIGAPAAILNAALDALAPSGVRDLNMPLTSETIWRALRDAKQT